MPQYDGPYTIVDLNEEQSTVTLDLPNSPNIHEQDYETLDSWPALQKGSAWFKVDFIFIFASQ